MTLSDKKLSELKALQGYVWRRGYEIGELKAPIYEDVYDAFNIWLCSDDIKKKRQIYIYSSGSTDAQILLFSHTEKGDLTPAIQGYFDTVTAGMKQDKTSYEKIAGIIAAGEEPNNILFLSDNVKGGNFFFLRLSFS